MLTEKEHRAAVLFSRGCTVSEIAKMLATPENVIDRMLDDPDVLRVVDQVRRDGVPLPYPDAVGRAVDALVKISEDENIPAIIRYAAAREILARAAGGSYRPCDEILDRLEFDIGPRSRVDWGRYTPEETRTLAALFRKVVGHRDEGVSDPDPGDIAWAFGMRLKRQK